MEPYKFGVGRRRSSLFWCYWSIAIVVLTTHVKHPHCHAWILGGNGHPKERGGRTFAFRPVSSYLFAVNDETDVNILKREEDDEPSQVGLSKNSDPDNDNRLVRYRGRVAYDGSYFSGFQIQQGRSEMRTIQGTLEEVLQARFRRPGLRVVGAGRTDAGVSARGQAFHFDLTPEEHEKLHAQKQGKPQPPLEYTMNRMLTEEIRVWNVEPAKSVNVICDVTKDDNGDNEEDDTTATRQFAWNAIHSSTHKLYSYRICVGPVMDPIHRFQRWHVPGDSKPANATLLAQSLKLFEGSHDFRAFAGAVEQTEKKAQRKIDTVRTIYKCQLIDESERYERDGYYRIDILLSGALYKMVRNMVGTAMDVSRGSVDVATLAQLLQSGTNGRSQLGRKDNRSKPAPPEGLTLERVFYDDDDAF